MDLAQAWTDNAAEYHDTAASLTRKVARIAFDNVVEELPKHGATIVDVACGTGALANIAAEKFDATSGTRIIACDFAPGMVKMVAENAAAHQWDHVKCEVMNGEALTLADECCQAVFCIAGVICMQDGIKAVHEMKRILTPGGLICFTTWKFVMGVPLAMESFKTLQYKPDRTNISRTPWNEKDWLEDFMAKAGFTHVSIQEAEAKFVVPDGELLDFGHALKNNPAFGQFSTGMNDSQKEAWPQALADAARNLYGKKDVHNFQNIAWVITAKK